MITIDGKQYLEGAKELADFVGMHPQTFYRLIKLEGKAFLDEHFPNRIQSADVPRRKKVGIVPNLYLVEDALKFKPRPRGNPNLGNK